MTRNCLLVFAGVALAACSLLESTSGLTGGTVTDPGDAGPGATDSATPSEASADGGSLDAGSGYCAALGGASTLLCEDFDTHALGVGWDGVHIDQGTVAISDAGYRSAPYSMAVAANGNMTAGYLGRRLSATTGHYDVHFAIRVGTAPSGTGYQILLTLDNGNGTQLELNEDTTTFSFNDRLDGTYGTYYASCPGLTLGVWHDVDLHVQLAAIGGTSQVVVTVDGNAAASFALAAAFNGPSSLGLGLGVTYGAGSMTAVEFDNVSVTLE